MANEVIKAMTDLTPDQLAEIEARFMAVGDSLWVETTGMNEVEAEFLTFSAQDIAALLAEVKRLQQQLMDQQAM